MTNTKDRWDVRPYNFADERGDFPTREPGKPTHASGKQMVVDLLGMAGTVGLYNAFTGNGRYDFKWYLLNIPGDEYAIKTQTKLKGKSTVTMRE